MSRCSWVFCLIVGVTASTGYSEESRLLSGGKNRSTGQAAEPVAVARPSAKVESDRRPDRQRVVYRVKHLPAKDLAGVLEELYRSEQAADRGGRPGKRWPGITAHSTTNSLVISGSKQTVADVVGMVEALDRRPARVHVRALIAECSGEKAACKLAELSDGAEELTVDSLAEAIANRPDVRLLELPQLHLIDNVQGTVHFGGREPRITGTSMGPGGQTHQITYENVGMILVVTARTNPEGRITLDVKLEKSKFGPNDESTPIAVRAGRAVGVPAIEILSLNTTVAVESGRTVRLVCANTQNETGRTEWILVISPTVEERP